MKYERLTERVYGETYSVNQRIYYNEVADIVERLAELEDKIENGTLIELPCKIDDKLYLVYSPFGEIDEWEITDIQIGAVNTIFRLGHKGTDDYSAVLDKELGEYAFLTREEAEKKLKELKGE